VQTRTKNALGALVLVAALGLCLFAINKGRAIPPGLSSRALDAVPAGAIVVAVADLEAIRKSPIGAKLLAGDRDIPGLGKVRDVCGIDPMDRVREVAIVVPAGGDEGDFGLVASGDVPDEALLACASKVIEARGGRPIVTSVGSFRTVRDATMVLSGAEIAVKKGGPILLGAGAYLRAMIDAADGRVPSIRSSVAHARLTEQVRGATLRATIVLTPKQREDLAQNLADQGGPRSAGAIVAGALGVAVGPTVAIHGVIACADVASCAEVATLLQKTRDRRAADVATRIVGFSHILEAIQIQAEGETIQISVELPVDEAATLLERLLVLRGVRHPMPPPSAQPSAGDVASRPGPAEPGSARGSGPFDAGAPDAMALPPPDEVLTAKGDAGAPLSDAGAGQPGSGHGGSGHPGSGDAGGR